MIDAAEALERLREGNRRFVSGATTHSATIDPASRAELVGGQTPFAIILACADSRVPVQLVFDEGPGDLFIIRVAGNIATPTQIGSIEYAVTQLGAELVVVLGHSGCGAVAAALESLAGDVPAPTANLEAIIDEIRPAIEGLGDASLDDAVVANVERSIARLKEGSPILGKLVESRSLTVTGATYALETGEVNFFD
ncbi:MAG: carbonic anhydrase [Woeseiaceae bacterium]|nr:carbonic anhydrase [Woeseiaceae bacterium]